MCIISNPSVNSNWSYSPETLNLGQNRQFFVLCDLQIWWMILENNRAPLLYYIKLCASFHSHQLIQSEVTVWKCPIWIKINKMSFGEHITSQIHGLLQEKHNSYPYKAVNFLQNHHWRPPIAHPLGWDIRCLLWVQIYIHILPQSPQWCIQ